MYDVAYMRDDDSSFFRSMQIACKWLRVHRACMVTKSKLNA